MQPARANGPFEPIVRERLLARFDAAAAYRVVLVTAPAGFGKSVAIRQYVTRRSIAHLRCGLRREHGTLLGFLGALAASLESVAPNMYHAYSGFYANVEKSPAVVSGIAQWVATMLKGYRGTIVVDDLHYVRNDDRIGELLVELVERTGTEIRWIFATRDPQVLPIATWLAYGVADVPIHEGELRLTLGEAASAASACDVVLGDRALHDLFALTDGWATAFAFALRISAHAGDLANVAVGTRDMIYRYLAEQVFRSLDERDRDFLLRTAPLPTLDMRVLREADFEDVAATIERLQRTTAFVTEEADRVYRYHDLFRDFLEHELKKNETHYAVAATDAATWLLRTGALPEALELYARAGNDDAIVTILEAEGAELFDRGQIPLLESVLDALPGPRIDASALVLTLKAMIAALREDYEGSDRMFAVAVACKNSADDRAHILMRYAITLSRRWKSSEAVKAVCSPRIEEIQDRKLRTRFTAFKAYALSSVGDEKADFYARRSLSDCREIDDVVLKTTVLQYVALVAFNQQRLNNAEDFAREALDLAEEYKLFGLAERTAMLLAAISCEIGDSDANLMHVMRMRRSAERIADTVAIEWTIMMAYGIHVLRGDELKIQQVQNELEIFSDPVEVGKRWPLLLPSLAMQFAWLGNFREAYLMIEEYDEYALGLPGSPWRDVLRYARKALYSAAESLDSVGNESLDRLIDKIAEVTNDRVLATRSLVLEARAVGVTAAVLLHREKDAQKMLESVEIDCKESTTATRLLVAAVRALFMFSQTGCESSVLQNALDRLRGTYLGGYARLLASIPIELLQAESKFSSLTAAELRVLIKIGGGATSKEIASEMGRSSLTIDTHVKSIVKKLGCSGRRAAVALARDGGIV